MTEAVPLPTPVPPPSSGHRFAYLDGVRGLAALMVAFSHYTLAFHPALMGGGPRMAHFTASVALSQTPLIFLINPELGVAIFFVLSGFVLASSVAGRDTPFAALAVRRWVRLGVPILGSTLLIWPLVQWHLFFTREAGPLTLSDWLGGNYLWVGFMDNSLLRLVWQSLFDIFLRARNQYNPALWTMPTEFWGSLGLFACYCGLRRWMAVPGVAFGVAVVALGAVWQTAYFGFPCGVALFEARRLLLRLSLARQAAMAPLAAPVGVALLAAGVLLGGTPYLIDLGAHGQYARLFIAMAAWFDNPVLLLHRVGAVCVVAAALLWRPMQMFLTTRACQFLGRVSFMLYLVHVPILCSLIAGLLLQLAPVIGYDGATAVLLPVFLGMVFLVADITTRLFDAPAIGLSHRAGRAVAAGIARMMARWRPSAGITPVT